MIYTYIMNKYRPSISHTSEQWENVIGVSLSDKDQDVALARAHSNSMTLSMFKACLGRVLSVKWATFFQLARIFSNLCPFCNKCKQATEHKCKQTTATIYHMLWSCSKLAPFWLSFFDAMSQTFGYDIQPSPLVEKFLTNLQKIWSHSCWTRYDIEHKTSENQTHTNGSLQAFYKSWDPFVNDVSVLPGLGLWTDSISFCPIYECIWINLFVSLFILFCFGFVCLYFDCHV